MEFKKGGWRYVFLVGDVAIKIARIKIFRALIRIIVHPFFEGRFKTTLRVSLNNHFRFGLVSNCDEYEYYQRTHDKDVMPSFLCLFGLIQVQYRGKPVTLAECEAECELYRFAVKENAEDIGEGKWFQYARHPDGTIRLVDYGGIWQLTEWLERTFPKRSLRWKFRTSASESDLIPSTAQ